MMCGFNEKRSPRAAHVIFGRENALSNLSTLLGAEVKRKHFTPPNAYTVASSNKRRDTTPFVVVKYTICKFYD